MSAICLYWYLVHRNAGKYTVSGILTFAAYTYYSCRSFDEFHQCAVTELERCKDNAPANIVDALLKFVRKVTPCNNFKKSIPLASTSEKEKSNGATLNFSIVTSVWLALFVKYFWMSLILGGAKLISTNYFYIFVFL